MDKDYKEIVDWLKENAVLAFSIILFFALIMVCMYLLCWYGFVSGFWSGVWLGFCTYTAAVMFMLFVVLGAPVDSAAGTSKDSFSSCCGFLAVDKGSVDFFGIDDFTNDGLFDHHGVDPYPIVSFLVKNNSGSLVSVSPVLHSYMGKENLSCGSSSLSSSFFKESDFLMKSASCDSKKAYVPIPLPDGHKELYLWYKCVRSNCDGGNFYNNCNSEWSNLQPYLIGEDLRLKGWAGYDKNLNHQFNVKLGESVKMVGFIELLNWYECKRNSVVHHPGNSVATCQSEWAKLFPHLICFDVDFPIGLLRGSVKNIYSGQAQRGFFVDSETQRQVSGLANKSESAKLTEFKGKKGPSVILIAQYDKEGMNLVNPVPKTAGSQEGGLSSKSHLSKSGLSQGGVDPTVGQFCGVDVKFSMENFYDKLDFSGVEAVGLGDNNMGMMYSFPGASFSEVYLNTEFGQSAAYAFSLDDPRFKVLKDGGNFIMNYSDFLIHTTQNNPVLVQEVLNYKANMVKLYENTNLALIQHILGTHFVPGVGSNDLGIQYVSGCINKSYELGVDILSSAKARTPKGWSESALSLSIANWENYHQKLLSRVQGLPAEVNMKKIENLRDFVSVDDSKSG